MDDKPQAYGFSLTNREMTIIAAESERIGLNNVSAALRKIINEWAAEHMPAVEVTK
jgi:hypothetical protein